MHRVRDRNIVCCSFSCVFIARGGRPEIFGSVVIVIKRNKEQADILRCARPANPGRGIPKCLDTSRQCFLNCRKLLFCTVLRPDVSELLQYLVQNVMRRRKNGTSELFVLK